MKLLFVGWGMVFWIFCGNRASAQISSFPYVERFDSIPDSTLPTGWATTTNRRVSGDFFASTSSARSSPHCLYSQNSTIAQSLTSPTFDFTNRTPDKLRFYLARSSTHTSGLLVEASVDNGATFSVALSDTIKNPGTTSYVLNTIQLPPTLANQNALTIRWRITGGAGGSTATFRIDDVLLTTLVTYDLSAVRLSMQPLLATSRDSIIFTAVVRNLGLQAAADYSIKFFCDSNLNLKPEPDEQFASVAGLSVAADDSLSVVAGHSPLRAGEYRIFAIVSFPQDEQPLNDTASTSVTIGYPKGSVLVNEFMYAPSGDEPEWVELLNCSRDTVNLRNWRISDNNTSSKSLITTSNLILPPDGYCIVTKDSSFGLYHPPVSCPIVVSSFSALNNTTPDAIVVYDPRLLAIDSVFYAPTWGGQGGKSLERIDVEEASVDSRNWGTSQDSIGNTPGRPNSIVRLTYDLSIGSCYGTRAEAESGLVPVINCAVRNAGKKDALSYSIRLYFDSNRDGMCQSDELITTQNAWTSLHPSDSSLYSFRWQSAPQGESVVVAVIDYPPDLRPGNNRASTVIQTQYNSRCVVINEIMYDPLANQNEWIELYNRGNELVDLKDWTFSDRPTASGNVNRFTVATHPLFLQPHTYVTIAADSSVFSLYPYLSNQSSEVHIVILGESGGISLSNDGDDIVLRDLTQATIDSVSYVPAWHRPDISDTKGRSLEKINPDLGSNAPSNWTTSVVPSGGTPGKPNSVVTVGTQNTSSLSFTPNPFSPDGDGFEDFCLVQYRLPLTTAVLHVKIFDIKGRLVRLLANSQISASQGELLWDGLDQNRQRVRIGPYIVLVQATDPSGKGTTTMKGVVVVAAKL